jgi:tetratricopeptide (TPR) repeat protein
MTVNDLQNGEVVRGRAGRLFLGLQPPFDIRVFLDTEAPGQTQILRWRRTFKRRAAALAARGIPYLFYIAPDAPSVYPEDLPAYLAPPRVTLGARLAEALRGIDNLHVLYPQADLLAAKGGLELYRKTDTHWSGYGAFVAYQALCKSLNGLIPFNPIQPRDIRFVWTPEIGDLGSLLTPEETGGNVSMRLTGPDVKRVSFAPGTHQMNSQRFLCDRAPPSRVLILRDSFMTEQAPLVARSFRVTEMVGTTSRLFLDHIDSQEFDLVISEIGERRLSLWENDHQMLGYADIFGTDWTSNLGRSALAAVMALDAGQLAAAASAAAVLLDQEVSLAPAHVFVAARVSLANGDAATADRLVTAALRSEPDRLSYLCIAAQTRFSLGDGVGAIRLMEQARRGYPENGFVFELSGYLLIGFGRPKEALKILDEASERLSDDAQLFHWASVAAEALNDHHLALIRMREAFALWPENPAYAERLEQLQRRTDLPVVAAAMGAS